MAVEYDLATVADTLRAPDLLTMTIPASVPVEERFDVCVVGTGPAGIVFSLEMSKARPDWKILLLEYGLGDDTKNDLDDTIVVHTPENHHPPEECTNKGFGGSSRTWGGRCVSYDEIDWLPRPIIGDTCTWSVDLFADVKRFYPETAVYFDCGNAHFDLSEIPELRDLRISDKFVNGDVLDTGLERWSLPTRFGPRYEAEVASRKNIVRRDGMKATRIHANGGMATGLDVLDRSSGQSVIVRADRYVIAAGAQESTRLLLKSPEVFSEVGGAPQALGLYYQGHISGKIASVKFTGNPKKTDFGFLQDAGAYIRRRFIFPTAVLERENLLNLSLFLDNPLYYDPSHRSGTMSVIYLMMLAPVIGKRLAPPAIANSVTKGKVYKVGGHLRNIVFGLPGSLIDPLKIFVKRYFPERKLPGVFLYNPQNQYALHFHGEQVPSVNNKMALGEDGESLHIYYRYEDVDVDSVIRAHEVLDKYLRRIGAGELIYWYPPDELASRIHAMSRDGIHQNGTTRIADSAERGVIDDQLRVFGVDNLYICSSSAFPTSGQANPTFLLGAFAVRLARHLAAK